MLLRISDRAVITTHPGFCIRKCFSDRGKLLICRAKNSDTLAAWSWLNLDLVKLGLWGFRFSGGRNPVGLQFTLDELA